MIFDNKTVSTQLNISDLNIKSRKLCLLQEKNIYGFWQQKQRKKKS